jgi:hypothetical protein
MSLPSPQMTMSEPNGSSPKAFTTERDGAANLLVIRYRGHVGAEEVERCAEEVLGHLESVEPGFKLLADLTALERMDISCVPHLENIMKVCNEKGVATVARIVPDPKRDIGLQIMSYFHYGPGVRVVTCETSEEAMEALFS